MSRKSIQVTEPFLPPLEEYVAYLENIWESHYLTNQGPLVRELESRLQAYHGLKKPVHCLANGSLGLQILLKAMGVKGEVVTTPFSYVATTSCPIWEGCGIKFADIEAEYMTLDPEAAEAAITSDTEAILATHVFGNPCDVEAFERIGKRYGIPIIYDAAHAFGVRYKGKSILEWGDASMVSMHATKLFHTIEGGFVVARDPEVSARIEWMRRFGHKGHDDFHGIGINAKLSELHAAMGLCMFKYIVQNILERKKVCQTYDIGLAYKNTPRRGPDQKLIHRFKFRGNADLNYSYYPVLFSSETDTVSTLRKLSEKLIFPRRYFFPSLNNVFKRYDCSGLEVTRNIASRILCLPLQQRLPEDSLERLINELVQLVSFADA